ncbi:aspartic peptidase domain-containing protein [Phycomyces blakesleeanus]|uniref:Aspartic peptidase domain-containing protein n=1 Tax=Phycomyces blakesleeanus TaxID=4837 RepID=A0ABR3AYX8_PHYBL
MRSAILCLAALAQLALSASAEPMKIPLYKRSNDFVKAGGKELSNGVLSGTVQIGTPPQEFTMAFDTTTGYSWVRGSRCKTENCLDRCTYYSRRSDTVTSLGKKFSVEYGDACVDTHVYLDTFNFAGLTVENMPFGGAYRMSGFVDGFDGYLGLGRDVNFTQTKIKSSAAYGLNKRDVAIPASAFVENAYQQGSGIESLQFGMYTTSTEDDGFSQSGVVTPEPTIVTNADGSVTTTNADGSTSTTATDDNTVSSGGFGFVKRHNQKVDGYLVLGGVDTSVIEGDVNYLPLSNNPDGGPKNWEVCIRDANFGSKLNLKQQIGAIAAISTSSEYISMPAHQADAFHKKFGGTYYATTKTYSIKCSKIKDLPPLKLQLETHIVEIPASYWTREIDNGRDCCATRISRGSSDRDWVLGSSFTNAFYTTFDTENDTLGLAIKKGTSASGLKIYKKNKKA